MKGTRKKMRAKGKPTITRFLKKFSVGDVIHVDILPSSVFPHPRFHGKTGKIVETRGDAYGVSIRDGSKMKTVFLKPEHIKKSDQ